MPPKIGIMSLYYILKGYRLQSTVDAIFSYWNIFNKVTLKPFRTLNGKKGPLTKDSNNVQEGWQIFFSVSSQIIKNRGLVGHTISTAATATAWNSQRVRKQVDVALFQQRFIWEKKKKKTGRGPGVIHSLGLLICGLQYNHINTTQVHKAGHVWGMSFVEIIVAW